MYVVYRFLIASKLEKNEAHEKLDEANEKLQELNKRDQIHYYTIIMEP